MEDQELAKLLIDKLTNLDIKLRDCNEIAKNTTAATQKAIDSAENAISLMYKIVPTSIAIQSEIENCISESIEVLSAMDSELLLQSTLSKDLQSDLRNTLFSQVTPLLTLVSSCTDTYMAISASSEQKILSLAEQEEQIRNNLTRMCSTIETMSQETSEQLIDTQSNLERSFESIEQHLHDIVSEVHRQTDCLKQLLVNTSATIEETSQDLITKHDQLFQQTVSQSVSSIATSLEQELTQQIYPMVDRLLALITEAMDKLQVSLVSAQKVSSPTRDMIERLIEELDGIREPISDVASNVRNLADKVSPRNFFGLFG